MVTKSPAGLPGLSLKHLFTLECDVGTPLIVGDGGGGKAGSERYTDMRRKLTVIV